LERLAEAEERMGAWVERAATLPADDSAVDTFREWVLDGYRAEGIPPDIIEVYDANTFWPMQVSGMRRWIDGLT
jgi:hypothetical protein